MHKKYHIPHYNDVLVLMVTPASLKYLLPIYTKYKKGFISIGQLYQHPYRVTRGVVAVQTLELHHPIAAVYGICFSNLHTN